MRTATAQNVKKVLEGEMFWPFGVPQIIICDNGKPFAIIKEMCDESEVKIRFTPYYHPQADSVERVIREEKTIISCDVVEN